MSVTAWDKLNTRAGGLKLRQNQLAGKPAQIVHEPPMDPEVMNYLGWTIDAMEKIAGSKDLSSLMQMGQIPNKDTIEKIIQSMSPSNRMRSRALEAFITEFAQMTMSNFMQFYTPEMRAAVLGPRGIVPQDFDLSQGDLMPDYLHGDDLTQDGAPTREAIDRGPRPQVDRATEFMRHFRYKVAPGSLLNAASIEKKLQYLMLARMGLVDHWTLLEELGVPNVGAAPDGADNITKRLAAEAQMGLGANISPVGRKATGQQLPNLKMTESS